MLFIELSHSNKQNKSKFHRLTYLSKRVIQFILFIYWKSFYLHTEQIILLIEGQQSVHIET